MYLPDHYIETRPEELHRLMTEFPLGALVLQGPGGLDANHLPFILDPHQGAHGHLLAHVAKANPLWREVNDGDEALVIFRAANAYISPNWYPTKQEHHRTVPTWNYQVVHAHGTIWIREDEAYLRGVVARLTRDHEFQSGQAKPWKMTDAPREYIAQQLEAIVGLEIRISRLVGKWKLGQNREERDRLAAADALGARGDTVTSAAMRGAGTRHS